MTYEDLEEIVESKGLPYVLGLLANIADNAAEYELDAGTNPGKAALWEKRAKVVRQAISDLEQEEDSLIIYDDL